MEMHSAPAVVLRGHPAQFRAEVSRLGEQVPAGRPGAAGLWEAHVQWVHQLLDRGDVSGAVRAWHDAYGAALDGPGWEGMLAVGDAFLRIGDVAHSTRGAQANAYQAYLVALVRAERAGSVDGMLQTATAFAGLDDHAVVAQCIRIARRLAQSRADDGALRHVDDFAERFARRFASQDGF
jgi:hypothetical protein